MERDEFIRLEPRLCKVLSNAMENDRVSHAYLLHGSPRCPFEDASFFVAKTLNCEKGGLACGECDSCKRFEGGIRPDFMVIDGRDGLIKKDDVLSLRDKYSMSRVENKKANGQRMSYVILQADNMMSKVANVMLKFLEEPMDGLTAILTTTNIERVLPTIRSRCEEIRLDAIPREDIYKSLVEGGCSPKAAYFLSDVSGDKRKLDELKDDDDFNASVKVLDAFIDAYSNSGSMAVYSLMRNAADGLKGSSCYNFFYGGLSRFFKDIASQGGLFSIYSDEIERHKDGMEVAIRANVLLDESIKQSNANMSFGGVLSRLGLILLNKD